MWLLAALELADEGDLSAKAWFEFDEEKISRDNHGRFAPQDSGGDSSSEAPEVKHWWHLTDNSSFVPNPDFQPDLNSMMGDAIENPPKGIFVSETPEYWMQAYGYERPYVAEISGPVTNPPGAVMMPGREQFLGGDMKRERVLTIDEYARETFHEPGWVEEYNRQEGEPVPKIPKDYVARTVDEMTTPEIVEYERKFRAWATRPDGPIAAYEQKKKDFPDDYSTRRDGPVVSQAQLIVRARADVAAPRWVWFDWNEEDHPRDDHGRFDGGGGGDLGEPVADAQTIADIAQGDAIQSIVKEGTPEGKGTRDDPLYVDGDLDRAVKEMAEGKSVRLDDEKQASILVGKLGDYAKELRDKGEKAPDFDLCGVSAAGTNVFCAGNIGVPRAEMPQLKTVAVDGSPAADLRKDPNDSNEEVDGAATFTAVLEASGVNVYDRQVPVSMLRASQNQLNGGKVGGMMHALEAGKLPPGAIWTTKDGYVLDGHHRWAATLAMDLNDGHAGDVKIHVREVDMEIGAAIDYARAFGKDFGLKQADVSQVRERRPKTAVVREQLIQAAARLAYLSDDDVRWLREQFEYNPDQARDDKGMWTKDGGDGGSDREMAQAEIVGVGNVKEFLDKNPPNEGEKIFEYQSRITSSLPPDAKHELLFHVRERYPSVPFVAQAASDWRASHGLPDPKVDVSGIAAPRAKAEIVAEHFERTPDQSNDPEVRAAYTDFKRENAEMFDYMTRPQDKGGMGMKVDFSPFEKGDPYPSASAQADDVRNNHHLTIQSGLGGNHSLMSVQEYDTFRAVHDTFGHTGTGAGFDRHGEYQTYLEHRSMYTGPAARAMATEYHGSNTALWGGAPGTPGTGKSILLPDTLIPDPWDKDGKLVKASTERETFAVGHEIEVSAGVKALASELELGDTFAAEYDRLPWHFHSTGAAPAPPPPLRASGRNPYTTLLQLGVDVTELGRLTAAEVVWLAETFYREDQSRDERGRFGEEGGGGGGEDHPAGEKSAERLTDPGQTPWNSENRPSPWEGGSAQHEYVDCIEGGHCDGVWTATGGGGGVSASRWYHADDGRDVLWKQSAGFGHGEQWSEVLSARVLDDVGLVHGAVGVVEWDPEAGNGPVLVEHLKDAPGVDDFVGIGWDASLRGERQASEDFIRMAVFDQVVANSDRHGGNFAMVRDDAGTLRIAPIDNSLAFGARDPVEHAIRQDNAVDNGSLSPRHLLREAVVTIDNPADVAALVKDTASRIGEGLAGAAGVASAMPAGAARGEAVEAVQLAINRADMVEAAPEAIADWMENLRKG